MAYSSKNKLDPYSKSSMWQERYRIAANNQQTMFKKFADWFDSMYAIVHTKNYAPWRSKIYVPILAGKTWSLISKFVGLKPGFEVRVRDSAIEEQEVEAKAEKMQRKLEFDYDNPELDEPMREKILSSLIDATVTGTGIAKVPWSTKNKVRYERVINEGGEVDITKEKKISQKIGYNDLTPVNIFNVFAAPGSSGFYSSPWIIIKEYKPLAELKAVNDSKGIEIYKNLDLLKNPSAKADEFYQYNKARNRLTNEQDPITADDSVGFICLYECYDRLTNKICTYAEAPGKDKEKGWVLIREQSNPYWHGKYPLVRFVIKKRPYDFWGEGIFEVSHRLQAATNDIFNHYMDNWNLSVDTMILAEENTLVNNYVVEPGGEITYRGQKPEFAKFPEPNPNQLQTVMSEIERAIEQVTVSQYASGMPSSATDKTKGTATGIIKLQEAAGDVISFMRANFQETVRQIGQFWLSNNQQFMTDPLTITITEKNQKLRPRF